MRAAILQHQKGELVIGDRAVPTPGRGEVLIRVRACGLCHGDLMVRNGDFPFVRFPIVPGHEVAGVVESVGEDVESVKPGARVGVPWLYSACGNCRECVAGNEVLCAKGQYTGMTVDGGYQQFMIARAAYVSPLPDALDFSEAAPLMCAGLTVYAGLVHAGFQAGDKVAIIGLGGLGTLGVLYTRAMGGRVAAISSDRNKEGIARELGVEHFIDADRCGESLRTWDGGADIILNVAPSPDGVNAALPGLAADGTLVLLAPVPISIDPVALCMRRQRVMGSPSGSRKELRVALALAATRGIRQQVTRFPLERAVPALRELEHTHPAGRFVLMMD